MFYPLEPHTSQRINSDNNHVLDIQAANPNLTLFYPYQEFKDRIHDPYFYPSIAHHWRGESAWVFAEAFAKRFDLERPNGWPTAPCRRRNVSWDIGRIIGFGYKTQGCDRNKQALGLITEPTWYPLHPGAPVKTILVEKTINPHATNEYFLEDVVP